MSGPDLSTRRRRRRPSGEALVGVAVVVGAAWFVLGQLQPAEIVRDTTPTGGDTGAHVWAPAYLRDHLLPSLRLSGWSPDWFGGFPVFRFYMVVPALLVVALDTVLPYNVAFKFVTVLGPVSLPVAAWAGARLAGLRRPMPELVAVATVPYLFDRYHTIWGGNLLATLSGEFAYAIGLSAAVLGVGLVVAGLRTGRHRASAAAVLAFAALAHPVPALFAVVATVVAVAMSPTPGRLRWFLTVGATSLALAAFWLLPFVAGRGELTDLGYVRDTRFWERLTRLDVGPDRLHWVFPLVLIGVLASVVRRLDFGSVVAWTTVVMAAAYVVVPQGQLWNARLLPLYYLGLFLLAGLGLGALVNVGVGGPSLVGRPGRSFGQLAAGLGLVAVAVVGLGVADGRARSVAGVLAATAVVLVAVESLGAAARRGAANRRARSRLRTAGMAVATLGVLVVVSVPLRVLPGGTVAADGTYEWGPFDGGDKSLVPTYAHWNYSGMEVKTARGTGGGFDEYRALVDTMAAIGTERGCGRAMWEYARELERYGTPMALMLLPYWTDGCIGSMEGLYFESSATVPFHFLNQSELSAGPSQAMRGLDYGGFDLDRGVEHLRLQGVRYYLAFSELALEAAAQHPDLDLLAESGPWRIYEVAGSDPVEALATLPVVVDGADDWLAVAQPAHTGELGVDVLLAESGPANWPRVSAAALAGPVSLPRVPVEPAGVGDVVIGRNDIRFRVDTVGVPVLVKASYFPTWTADGADGPYRVGPNQMVVVPTQEEVRLSHNRAAVDIAGGVVSIAGLMALVAVARRGRIDVGAPPRPPVCLPG